MITALITLIALGAGLYILKPVQERVTLGGEIISSKIWQLNENSWHTKYYKWLTHGNDLTCGGCKYFWTIFGLTLLLIAFLPFVIVAQIIMHWPESKKEHSPEYYEKKWARQDKRRRRGDKVGKIAEVIGKVFLGIFLLTMITILIHGIATEKDLWWILLGAIGTVLVLFGLVYLVSRIWSRFNVGRRIINSAIIQVPRSIIISIYTRACPRIIWNKKLQHETQKTQEA